MQKFEMKEKKIYIICSTHIRYVSNGKIVFMHFDTFFSLHIQ